MAEATKAVLYAAKSTEDERGSIPTQLAECRDLAEREGWEVADEFQDEAASAWSGNRGPGLVAAKELAERLAPAVLVVQHSDRLARGDGRNAEHLADVYSWSVRAKVTIRSVQDDLFADERMGRVMAALMGMRNTEDSRRKSEATRAGMRRAREAGKWTGGRPPFGTETRDTGERGRGGKPVQELAPIKTLVPVVRRIFDEYVAGRSQLGITRGLVADGVPTAKGGDWHQGTVRGILANSVYVKLGMIEQETWDKAEALRKAKARTYGSGRPPAGQHLFRKGMLRCECGEAMVPRTDPNRQGAPRESYYCYGRKQDPDSCSMAPLPRELIDSAVYRYFEQVGLDVDATRQQLADSREAKLAEVGALLEQAQRAERQAVEAHERIRNDYKRGALPADEWRDEWKPELEEELAATSAEVERLAASEAEVRDHAPESDVEADVLSHLAAIRKAIAGEVKDAEGVEAVRAALSRLFDRFIVHPAGAKLGRKHRDDPVPKGPSRRELLDVDGYMIEVWVREQVLEGYDEKLLPILTREPLGNAENNYAEGFGR